MSAADQHLTKKFEHQATGTHQPTKEVPKNSKTSERPSSVRSVSESRRHVRTLVEIPVLLQSEDHAIACRTVDMSPAGLRIASDTSLQSGTPLELTFCVGEVCYLHISGQVLFCTESRSNQAHHIGVAFSAIRDWEQLVLLSALKELGDSSRTRNKSLVTIKVSRDRYAIAASEIQNPSSNTLTVDEGNGSKSSSETLTASPEPSSSDNVPLWHATAPIVETPQTSEIEAAPGIEAPCFTLLLNGEDLDTRSYKYCFYADKLVSEHRAVLHVLRQLKRGRIPAKVKDYIFATYCIGGRDTNQAAMRAAHAASKEFRFFSLAQRMRIATDIHGLLVDHKKQLIDLMVKEGHPLRLAEWEFTGMEQAYRKESLEFYSQHLRAKIGVQGEESFYLTRKPDGVVGVCPPRNAPCSSSLIAGFALLAGNTLIVKPPLHMPVSTIFLWKNVVNKALQLNNAPRGTLNIVTGNSSLILEEWITGNYVNDILFIGESTTGLEIGRRAFQWGKKPVLELSGNDMMFVWRDADISSAVESLLDGFMGSTQICMVPKKAFVHEDIYQQFETRFVEAIKTLRVGLPSDPEVLLSPVAKMGKFQEFLYDALSKGAELLCGGTRVDHRGLPDQDGPFILPSVLRISDEKTAIDMKCVRDENFFPLIPLIKVSGTEAGDKQSEKDDLIFKKMIAAANSNAYGLRVSVWVKSEQLIETFMEQIHNSGLIRINCRHAGFSPFLATHGGTGRSGGPFGELNYVWQKTSHLQGIALTQSKQSTE